MSTLRHTDLVIIAYSSPISPPKTSQKNKSLLGRRGEDKVLALHTLVTLSCRVT